MTCYKGVWPSERRYAVVLMLAITLQSCRGFMSPLRGRHSKVLGFATNSLPKRCPTKYPLPSLHRDGRIPFATSSSDQEWPANRVRQTFMDYFVQKHGHTFFPSSPVVPLADPTLLFANAGMNQYKPIFLGQADPNSPLAKLERAVNSQKCIRAGGKHNDLEDVGMDTYHHTFFEMLGSWSFGDYFKEEAIRWAWELLTDVYGLPPDRLYVTYFGGDAAMGVPPDDEARDLWLRFLPPERVLPFGKKENFWEMGETGPCGPCSEIHFDRVGGRDAAALVNQDDPDVLEIWNLVFIQFNREEEGGSLRLLPAKHVDTGMGLERLVSIMQDKRSNYDTDVFAPLFAAIRAQVQGPAYAGKLGSDDVELRDTAYRVVADHVRTLAFAIADGALPSNEGRGYVLRRVLRRAVRYGKQILGGPPGFFAKLVPAVVDAFGDFYPELREKEAWIVEVIADEEKGFGEMLERGIKYFGEEVVGGLRKQGGSVVSAEQAFFLYDTLGFPVDLTRLMAVEEGFDVDLEGFGKEMEKAKQRSKAAALRARAGAGREGERPLLLQVDETAWLQGKGVEHTDDAEKYGWEGGQEGRVLALFTHDGFVDEVRGSEEDAPLIGVILDRTAFYAEAGGAGGRHGEAGGDGGRGGGGGGGCASLRGLRLAQWEAANTDGIGQVAGRAEGAGAGRLCPAAEGGSQPHNDARLELCFGESAGPSCDAKGVPGERGEAPFRFQPRQGFDPVGDGTGGDNRPADDRGEFARPQPGCAVGGCPDHQWASRRVRRSIPGPCPRPGGGRGGGHAAGRP
ncbi:alanyl-trna synthetase [Nannochloropsis gaditana]|uniref:Alanine--tRNA ligase n=1 Tax=Nannochloropsis gaditana TaxID=72520 RepID=W7T5P6_9STRA|nr:alanyl-trna synthetase [Nannochloropsis gaditana]